MKVKTKIGWTDYTHNIVRGCSKVARGCKHCYAERLIERWFPGQQFWGTRAPRMVATPKYWRKLYGVQKKAKAEGIKKLCFVGSLCDFAENHPITRAQLPQLWEAIDNCPDIIFQLLTKRPQNVKGILPPAWLHNPPSNVWIGASVATQRDADENTQHLEELSYGFTTFFSIEPLVSMVTIREALGWGIGWGDKQKAVKWVIIGGESGGRDVQPMHPSHVDLLLSECEKSKTPAFFKQWGNYNPITLPDALEQKPRHVVTVAADGTITGTYDLTKNKDAHRLVDYHLLLGTSPYTATMFYTSDQYLDTVKGKRYQQFPVPLDLIGRTAA